MQEMSQTVATIKLASPENQQFVRKEVVLTIRYCIGEDIRIWCPQHLMLKDFFRRGAFRCWEAYNQLGVLDPSPLPTLVWFDGAQYPLTCPKIVSPVILSFYWFFMNSNHSPVSIWELQSWRYYYYESGFILPRKSCRFVTARYTQYWVDLNYCLYHTVYSTDYKTSSSRHLSI